jgi:hypothetical protein
MSALFVRDIWPAWSAQDAPPVKPAQLEALSGRGFQYELLDDQGRRVGMAWARISGTDYSATVRGTLVLTRFRLLPSVRVETETTFDREGALDSFSLHVYGLPMTRIHARGERRGIYFPCELHAGPFHREVNLEMSATRLIGGSFRPFSYLPKLEVGQSWRMQLLDPLSAITGGQPRFKSLVARVTREETITHQGQSVRCHVVETSPQTVTAWVGPDGAVLLQEVDLPAIGLLRIRAEPYDSSLRERMIQQIGPHNESRAS